MRRNGLNRSCAVRSFARRRPKPVIQVGSTFRMRSKFAAMAASLTRLGNLALQNTRRIPSRRKAPFFQPCRFRPLHTTPVYRRPNENQSSEIQFDINALEAEDREQYNLLSPEEKQGFEEEYIALHKYMTSPEVEAELNAEVAQAAYEVQQRMPPDNVRPPRIKPGLMSMGELDEEGTGEDEEFKGDDISSSAHGELEQHREKREYARIAAWEMPLLSSMSPSPKTAIYGLS